MGKASVKEDKTIYQLKREAKGLTRPAAEEAMMENDVVIISEDRLEKLENDRIRITPFDVVKMAKAYNSPELCNHFCKYDCEIGKNYELALEIQELPQIILELIAKLNAMSPMVNRLIEITYNGDVTDEEVPDFAKIKATLDQVVLAADALDLWIEKTIDDNKLNEELFLEELEKHKK